MANTHQIGPVFETVLQDFSPNQKEIPMDDDAPVFLTAAMAARRYGGVTPRTLRVWEADPRKRFPKSFLLGGIGRKYYLESELLAWEAKSR